VLGNLLTNASDAISDLPPELRADEELGVIRLSATKVSKDSKDWVVIEVEDTGGGIADENRAEVLLPFMTTKTLHRGTGLGLFTAESIIREHGGYMEIDTSESLGGAKISLWFPVLI
jgi:signal transduction histidine kinase